MDKPKKDVSKQDVSGLDTISKRLKFVIEGSGIKQSHMAKKLKITKAAVSYILNSDVKSSKSAMRLAEELNVNKHWLLTGEGEIYKQDKPEIGQHIVPVYYLEQLKLAARQGEAFKEPIAHVLSQRLYKENCFAVYLRINDFAPRFETGDQLIFVDRNKFVNNDWILVYCAESDQIVLGQGIHTNQRKALLLTKESAAPTQIDFSKDHLLGVFVEGIKLANYTA